MPNGEENSDTKQQYKDDDDYYFTEFTFLRFWRLFGCSQLVHQIYTEKIKQLPLFDWAVFYEIIQWKDEKVFEKAVIYI